MVIANADGIFGETLWNGICLIFIKNYSVGRYHQIFHRYQRVWKLRRHDCIHLIVSPWFLQSLTVGICVVRAIAINMVMGGFIRGMFCTINDNFGLTIFPVGSSRARQMRKDIPLHPMMECWIRSCCTMVIMNHRVNDLDLLLAWKLRVVCELDAYYLLSNGGFLQLCVSMAVLKDLQEVALFRVFVWGGYLEYYVRHPCDFSDGISLKWYCHHV